MIRLPLFIVMGLSLTVSAQNLVPNPSFEEYAECPDGEYDIDLAFPWSSYRQTPDYFNACDDTEGAGVPYSNIYGYQYPYHGKGQAGLIAAAIGGGREIIGTPLINPLEIGEVYYISFYANRGFGGGFHSNCDCAVNNLGIKFLNRAYSVTETVPIDNQPDFYYGEVITDTLAWELVSGWFTADSAYTHIALGNFFEESFNTLENYNGYDFYNTYYFIDAVCISKNPSDCDVLMSSAGQNRPKTSSLLLYPNPANDVIWIQKQMKSINQLRVYDSIGNLIIKTHPFANMQVSINISLLAEGTYMLMATYADGTRSIQTFLKTK